MSTENLMKIADQIEHLKDQMKENLSEIMDLVRDANEEADGYDSLMGMFEAYPYANIKTFLDDDSGYMSNNHTIQKTVDKIRQAAEELDGWEDEEDEEE